MVSIEYTVTDGSKSSDRVASAVVARNSAKSVQLPDKELNCTHLLLHWILSVVAKTLNSSSFQILMSSLEALSGFKTHLDLVLKIKNSAGFQVT